MNSIELMEEKGFEFGGMDIGDGFFFMFWLDRTPQLCKRLGMEYQVSDEKAVADYVEKLGFKDEYATLPEKMKMMLKISAIHDAKGAFLAHWYKENDFIVVCDENNMENRFVLEGEEKELFKKAVYEAYLKGYCDLIAK